MTKPTPISLARLLKPAGAIELEDGTVHEVRPITGRAYDLLTNRPDDADVLLAVYDVVQLLVPSVSRDQALGLTAEQCEAVIAIASGQAEAVAALAPNPTGETAPAHPSPRSRAHRKASRPTGSGG